jgi:hypothetical protein
MAAGRNRKGQFTKGSRKSAPKRKASTAIARRGPSRVTIRESGPGSIIVAGGGRAPARRTGGAVRRRSGGGALGSVGKWFGAPRTEDLVASAALGWVVGNRRATVDEVLSKAPDFVKPIGGFGVAALGFGILGELVPGVRKWTGPLARQSAGLAAYHLGRRGSLYEAKGDILGGLDDDSTGADDEGDMGADEDMGADDE